jgi:hypothetical protein
MHLVQVLLPLYDNERHRFDDALFAAVQQELTERFGGVTAYLRSPALGAWKKNESETDYDQIIIVEVMADELDAAWWQQYRKGLERRFRQDTIVVRASAIDLL